MLASTITEVISSFIIALKCCHTGSIRAILYSAVSSTSSYNLNSSFGPCPQGIMINIAVADLELRGLFLKPPLRFQKTSCYFSGGCIEIEGSAMLPFLVELRVFQVIKALCVRLGVLLLAKFNYVAVF